MTKNRHDEIRRRLSRNDVPPPPPDLLAKLKHQIPEHLDFASGRERDTVRSFRGSAWRIAASIILMTGIGWLGLITIRNDGGPFTAKKEMAVRALPSAAPAETGARPATPAPAFAGDLAVAPPVKQAAPPTVMADARAAAPQEERAKEQRRDETDRYAPETEMAATGAKDLDEKQDVKVAELKKVERSASAAETSVTNAPAIAMQSKSADAGVVGGSLAAAAPQPPRVQAPAAARASREAANAAEPAGAEDSLRQLPVPVECDSAPYPAQARKAGDQGVVVIAATIGPDGRVEKTEIIRSLPHGLGKAAEQAVRNCRFKPATLDGQPIRTRFEIPVRFDLQKGACVLCEAAAGN